MEPHPEATIQIKPLATTLVNERLPSFALYPKKDGYWFRRCESGIHQIIVCNASFKYCSIEFDLYCGIFSDWAGNYGTHLGWSGLRLDNLRYGSGALDVDKIGYPHDQTHAGILSALSNGVDGLEQFALPYFRTFGHRILTHPVVLAGFEYIRSHEGEIPQTVDSDIQLDLRTNGFFNITNPHFIGLRDHLREVARKERVSRDDKKDISFFVFDVYRLYSERGGRL